ncbi:MAG TPA: cell wall hydrolase [Gammaproteobacteria bacterium]|nr:cell wall hydrolase [Gammaproteobacteria bacterium]
MGKAALRLVPGPTAVGPAFVALVAVLAQAFTGVARAAPIKAEQRCLAEAMYWEARGEGRRGMIAVGWTVLNRMKSPRFPSTACGVVHQGGERPPCEFAYWCDGRSDEPRELRSWRSALGIAHELLHDPPRDPTHGALYFHNRSVRTPHHRVRTARIGAHVFYR